VHYSCVMRNVTITLEEQVAAWARVRAAQLDQSLSSFVAGLLRAQMSQNDAYEAAMAAFLAEKPVRLKRHGKYPDRDSLHDRAGLR
jgi:hypothetical protein